MINNTNLSSTTITTTASATTSRPNTEPDDANDVDCAAAVENTKLYYLAPAGHCPHHETPEIVNELITDFVACSHLHQHGHSTTMSITNTDSNNTNTNVKNATETVINMKTEYQWQSPMTTTTATTAKTVLAKQSYGKFDDGFMSNLGQLIDDYKDKTSEVS